MRTIKRTAWRSGKKVFPYRRENIHENHFLIKHGRAVPGSGRKMQHVSRLSNSLFVSDGEQNRAALDNRHLLMRMVVSRGNNVGSKTKPAHHQLFADNHLPFDTFF